MIQSQLGSLQAHHASLEPPAKNLKGMKKNVNWLPWEFSHLHSWGNAILARKAQDSINGSEITCFCLMGIEIMAYHMARFHLSPFWSKWPWFCGVSPNTLCSGLHITTCRLRNIGRIVVTTLQALGIQVCNITLIGSCCIHLQQPWRAGRFLQFLQWEKKQWFSQTDSS